MDTWKITCRLDDIHYLGYVRLLQFLPIHVKQWPSVRLCYPMREDLHTSGGVYGDELFYGAIRRSLSVALYVHDSVR